MYKGDDLAGMSLYEWARYTECITMAKVATKKKDKTNGNNRANDNSNSIKELSVPDIQFVEENPSDLSANSSDSSTIDKKQAETLSDLNSQLCKSCH
jgi:hypothetical protein